jgi:hypothetical protein
MTGSRILHIELGAIDAAIKFLRRSAWRNTDLTMRVVR